MPVLPDLVGRDRGVACDLLVDVRGVDDNALGQYHWPAGLHLQDEAAARNPRYWDRPLAAPQRAEGEEGCTRRKCPATASAQPILWRARVYMLLEGRTMVAGDEMPASGKDAPSHGHRQPRREKHSRRWLGRRRVSLRYRNTPVPAAMATVSGRGAARQSAALRAMGSARAYTCSFSPWAVGATGRDAV